MSNVITLVLVTIASWSIAQNCDCEKNYEWVKKTFEENDAGFEYALKQKGIAAYAQHNQQILQKVKSAKALDECTAILFEWLTFFRPAHIAISRNESQNNNTKAASTKQQFKDWETYTIASETFTSYLDKVKDMSYEGIWETGAYKIGIKREGSRYIGFIIESGADTWTKAQVKLKINTARDSVHSVFYMRDHSAVVSDQVVMTGKNHLQIGTIQLTRLYPKIEEEAKYLQYFKALNAAEPYLEKLNATTLYLRIPSFNEQYKHRIDSILQMHKTEITGTQNLIIDIRNNGGGSDATYAEIIPFLYTNPIRGIGVEYYSTKLNNQRMLDFINDPDYGMDEEGKQWAKAAYEKLESKLGQFVNLDSSEVVSATCDTIYPFPQNVGIIINEANGSTAEQFLLEAKQSKKVKLFGVTTFGVLDISNMYFVDSPCREFKLGYCLTRSLRIPYFTIDDKGIQPDYYLDKQIPQHEWTNYVNSILSGR